MEGLLTFLAFAGLFYLMMRYGCGAHMVHGHGRQGMNHRAPGSPSRDPVCGMNVAPTTGYGRMYQGREYRFCSRQCLDQFDAAPERYLSEQGETP